MNRFGKRRLGLMKTNKIAKILPVTVIVLLSVILVITVPIHMAAGQSTFQTWNMVVTSESGSHSGTLDVLSDGDFTSQGFTGSTSQGTYDISEVGTMSGTSITFTETASYDSGNGYIYGNGVGTLNAAFPAATSASGTISGTISDPLGQRSYSMDFTATKTSGGSSNGGSSSSGSGFFSSLGVAVGATGANAATIGALFLAGCIAFPIAMIVGITIAKRKMKNFGSARKSKKAKLRNSHPVGYTVSPAAPPAQSAQSTTFGLNAGPIEPGGVNIGGPGASVGPSPLGALPFLNGDWMTPGLVTLSWDKPLFDPSKYNLVGYDVFQQTYVATNTAPTSIQLGTTPTLGSNTNSTTLPFTQTYSHSTGGDIVGYRVDPVFQEITPQGVGPTFHSGGIGIRVGQPYGTLGVGP